MATKKQIADLHAKLTADVRQYMADMQNAARRTQQTEKSISGSLNKAANATKGFNTAQQAGTRNTARFGQVMQQSGYQVQDFAVQVAGGQSALVAFSQQGSQLLGIFGPAGAIAGAGLAIGVLATQFYKASQNTKDANEELSDYIKSLNDLAAARREAWLGSASPEEVARGLGVEVRAHQHALQVMEGRLAKYQRRMAMANSVGGQGLENTQMVLPDGTNEDDLRLKYGSNWQERFDWRSAGGRWMDEGEAFEHYARLIEETGTRINVVTEMMEEKQRRIAKEEKTISENRMKQWEDQERTASKTFEGIAAVQKTANDETERIRKAAEEASAREEQRLDRLADRYRVLADPAKRYRDQIEEINMLLEKGKLAPEEAAGGIDKLHASIAKLNGENIAVELEKFFGEIDERSKQNIEDHQRRAKAFADLLLAGENAFGSLVDVVARSVVRIATQMAIINPILNAIGGGFAGYVPLTTFFNRAAPVAGTRASGGPTDAGRTYLVGENGPELFTANRSGYVTSNRDMKTVATGGGGNIYQIDARGADEGAVSRIEHALMLLAGPGVTERRALTAQVDNRRRGGSTGFSYA